MISLRWACLALFLCGAVGCGSSDPSNDPAAAALIKRRIDKIERLKAQAEAAKAARTARPIVGRRTSGRSFSLSDLV